jgi:hypothetical protein
LTKATWPSRPVAGKSLLTIAVYSLPAVRILARAAAAAKIASDSPMSRFVQ